MWIKLHQKIFTYKKFDIKQDEANGKAEEGEKQRKLEEDKVKHNRHVEQKRKRDKQGEEKTKMEGQDHYTNLCMALPQILLGKIFPIQSQLY